MEKHILREVPSSWNQGVPTFALPCKPYGLRRPNASNQFRIPCSSLDSDWTLDLTAWFSYHVVSFRLHTCSTNLPRRTAILLFTKHSVTACQSTRGHQERTQNPCQQSLYSTYSSKKLFTFSFFHLCLFDGVSFHNSQVHVIFLLSERLCAFLIC